MSRKQSPVQRIPAAWQARLEIIEEAHESHARERSSTRRILIGAAFGIVASLLGAAAAYGELRGQVSGLREQVQEIHQDLRQIDQHVRER